MAPPEQFLKVDEGVAGSPAPDPTPTPPAAAPGPRTRAKEATKPTRLSAAFRGVIAGAIVLILLLIFILENTRQVPISYFGATGRISLGVALLLAAIGGSLLTGLLGAARLAQVRHRIKHRL